MKNHFYIILTFLLTFHLQTAFCQWEEINSTITASFLNSGIAYEGKMYFAGGAQTQFVTATIYTKKVEVLDLETQTVSQAGEISIGRCGMAAVAYDGKIYFLGGQKWTSTTSAGVITYDNVDIYDIASGTWTLQHLSLSRTAGVAGVVAGKIIYAGGWHATSTVVTPSDVVDIYDPSTGLWTVEHLSVARGEMIQAGVVGNKFYVCGGGTGWVDYACTDVVDIYDASTNAWSTTQLSLARMTPSVVGVGKYLVVAGGYTQTLGKTDRVDILDTETETWTTHSLSSPRCLMAAVALGEKAYFTGGGNLNLATVFFNQTTNDVDIFDAATGMWGTSNLTKNRMAHTAAAWDCKVVVGGGWRAEQGQTTGSIEVLCDSSLVAVKDFVESPQFSVFPNPTSNVLNVSLSENQTFVGNASLVVIDLYGKVLVKKELEHGDWGRSLTLNLNEIPAGGYFLILDTEANGRAYQRFVVLR